MKYADIPQLVVDMMSPPSRGAWIEIIHGCKRLLHPTSPPARGAWIEMQKGGGGETARWVAPLAGGVA